MARLALRIDIDAPQELLWGYLTTASGLACWQADSVEGSLEQEEFSLRWPGLGVRLDLSVGAISHREWIVLRAGQNQLRLSLQRGAVVLEHDGLDEADDLEGLRCSWSLALRLLKHSVERHPEAPRQVRWSFTPIAATPELLHYYFSTQAGLRAWLGELRSEFESGEPYRIETDLFELSGQVLVNDIGRDVALSVRQLEDGAIVLRSLPAPRGRVAAAGVSTWGPCSRAETVAAHLEESLARLAQALGSRGIS